MRIGHALAPGVHAVVTWAAAGRVPSVDAPEASAGPDVARTIAPTPLSSQRNAVVLFMYGPLSIGVRERSQGRAGRRADIL